METKQQDIFDALMEAKDKHSLTPQEFAYLAVILNETRAKGKEEANICVDKFNNTPNSAIKYRRTLTKYGLIKWEKIAGKNTRYVCLIGGN
jgi:hypothetical protein